MALTLLFLGPLEDVAGSGEMLLDVEAPLAIADIAERLPPKLAVAITDPRVRMAVNGSLLAAAEVRAGEGDELAFLPPVSGG